MVSPMEIAALAGVGLLLFGAERLPKLARSAGEMRREFIRGQAEAEMETVTGHTEAKHLATSPEATPLQGHDQHTP